MKNTPPLIYGTAWKKEKTAELVEKAILCGFRGIDTACQPKHYNEPGVGIALQRLKEQGIERKSLFIQTKFTPFAGQDPHNVPYNPCAPIAEQVAQSFQTSLKNLGVEYLDAILLHSPLETFEETMQAWRMLEKLCEQGSIEKIGMSNCYGLSALKQIFDQAVIKPSFLQNRFYAQTGYDKNLRRFCDDNNILYQSFWTLTANPHILSSPLLDKLARAKKATVEQLFFRYLTQIGIIPCIGTCSEKHMKEDLAVFNFTLTDDEISQMDGLLAV